jgi:hypothetical protein
MRQPLPHLDRAKPFWLGVQVREDLFRRDLADMAWLSVHNFR